MVNVRVTRGYLAMVERGLEPIRLNVLICSRFLQS